MDWNRESASRSCTTREVASQLWEKYNAPMVVHSDDETWYVVEREFLDLLGALATHGISEDEGDDETSLGISRKDLPLHICNRQLLNLSSRNTPRPTKLSLLDDAIVFSQGEKFELVNEDFWKLLIHYFDYDVEIPRRVYRDGRRRRVEVQPLVLAVYVAKRHHAVVKNAATDQAGTATTYGRKTATAANIISTTEATTSNNSSNSSAAALSFSHTNSARTVPPAATSVPPAAAAVSPAAVSGSTFEKKATASTTYCHLDDILISRGDSISDLRRQVFLLLKKNMEVEEWDEREIYRATLSSRNALCGFQRLEEDAAVAVAAGVVSSPHLSSFSSPNSTSSSSTTVTVRTMPFNKEEEKKSCCCFSSVADRRGDHVSVAADSSSRCHTCAAAEYINPSSNSNCVGRRRKNSSSSNSSREAETNNTSTSLSSNRTRSSREEHRRNETSNSSTSNIYNKSSSREGEKENPHKEEKTRKERTLAEAGFDQEVSIVIPEKGFLLENTRPNETIAWEKSYDTSFLPEEEEEKEYKRNKENQLSSLFPTTHISSSATTNTSVTASPAPAPAAAAISPVQSSINRDAVRSNVHLPGAMRQHQQHHLRQQQQQQQQQHLFQHQHLLQQQEQQHVFQQQHLLQQQEEEQDVLVQEEEEEQQQISIYQPRQERQMQQEMVVGRSRHHHHHLCRKSSSSEEEEQETGEEEEEEREGKRLLSMKKEEEEQAREIFRRGGLCGLINVGNTCFLNSAVQCLSKVMPLSYFFLSNKYLADLNEQNILGTRGRLARAYCHTLREMWMREDTPLAPRELKWAVGRVREEFLGYNQQDSQELIAFLLDGLHEDLNRVKKKPYYESKIEGGPEKADAEVAELSWQRHKEINDSFIVDCFQGLYRSRLQCPQCRKISKTFDPFMYLSLPVPPDCGTITFALACDPLLPSGFAFDRAAPAPLHYHSAKDVYMEIINKLLSTGPDQPLNAEEKELLLRHALASTWLQDIRQLSAANILMACRTTTTDEGISLSGLDADISLRIFRCGDTVKPRFDRRSAHVFAWLLPATVVQELEGRSCFSEEEKEEKYETYSPAERRGCHNIISTKEERRATAVAYRQYHSLAGNSSIKDGHDDDDDAGGHLLGSSMMRREDEVMPIPSFPPEKEKEEAEEEEEGRYSSFFSVEDTGKTCKNRERHSSIEADRNSKYSSPRDIDENFHAPGGEEEQEEEDKSPAATWKDNKSIINSKTSMTESSCSLQNHSRSSNRNHFVSTASTRTTTQHLSSGDAPINHYKDTRAATAATSTSTTAAGTTARGGGGGGATTTAEGTTTATGRAAGTAEGIGVVEEEGENTCMSSFGGPVDVLSTSGRRRDILASTSSNNTRRNSNTTRNSNSHLSEKEEREGTVKDMLNTHLPQSTAAADEHVTATAAATGAATAAGGSPKEHASNEGAAGDSSTSAAARPGGMQQPHRFKKRRSNSVFRGEQSLASSGTFFALVLPTNKASRPPSIEKALPSRWQMPLLLPVTESSTTCEEFYRRVEQAYLYDYAVAAEEEEEEEEEEGEQAYGSAVGGRGSGPQPGTETTSESFSSPAAVRRDGDDSSCCFSTREEKGGEEEKKKILGSSSAAQEASTTATRNSTRGLCTSNSSHHNNSKHISQPQQQQRSLFNHAVGLLRSISGHHASTSDETASPRLIPLSLPYHTAKEEEKRHQISRHHTGTGGISSATTGTTGSMFSQSMQLFTNGISSSNNRTTAAMTTAATATQQRLLPDDSQQLLATFLKPKPGEFLAIIYADLSALTKSEKYEELGVCYMGELMSPPNVDISDCLHLFSEQERLDKNNMWYCNACREHVQAFKKLDLWKIPRTLILHLKRFHNISRWNRAKIGTKVTFPYKTGDYLDMTPYILPESLSIMRAQNPGFEPLYELASVNVHSGDLGGGHYFAYVKLRGRCRLSNIYDLRGLLRFIWTS